MFGIASRINRHARDFVARLESPSFPSEDLIAKGDRLAAAKASWPEDRWPTLYRDIPDDIRRPIVWDGRVLGGREVGWLSWRHLSLGVVEEAVRVSGHNAFRSASFISGLVFVLWLIALLPAGSMNLGLLTTLFSSTLPILVKVAALASFLVTGIVTGVGLYLTYSFFGGRNPKALLRFIVAALAMGYVGASSIDALVSMFTSDMGDGSSFNGSTVSTLQLAYPAWAAEVGDWSPVFWYYVAQAALYLTIAPAVVSIVVASALVFGLLFPALWTFGTIATLREWAHLTGAPYTRATRDAVLLWKAKSDGSRDAEYQAYCRQVDDACGRLADLPLIPVGRATGLLRARGDMKAPTKGQIIGYDGESIRQHTLVLGDTGSGKTLRVLRPMFTKIMNASWGADHRIAAYVTDGKGTLWRDLLPIVAHRDDVTVIGTGEGQVGVDLLKGMTPLEVSTTFRNIASQIAGSSGGDFWTESASLLVMHAAIIAKALEADPRYVEEHIHDGDPRLYSLAGLLTLATDAAAQKAALLWLVERSKESAEELGPDLHQVVMSTADSAVWMTGFLDLASETRGSIISNVNVVLGKLTSAGELSIRFANGTYDDCADVDLALQGGVVMVAIGDTEYGLAGRVVSTWLKQRLFVLAKRRLVQDPDACRKVSVALVADEYQMLVTAGPDSDTTFWNIARETGVFLLAATQSVAALKQTLGAEQTANILNLLRSKIVLSTGEIETIDYVRKIAGDLPMGWEPDEGFYATHAMRELAEPSECAPVVAAFPMPLLPTLHTPSMSAPVSLDQRFMGNRRASLESNISAQQSAYWRHEDKSKEALTSGLSWAPKIRHDELRHGQGFAFAMLYRAGSDRTDIIDLRGA